jgi:hypothetical protein
MSTTLAPEVITEEEDVDEVTILVPDKEEFTACDACGHRSYVYVFVQPALLSYCGHHATKYEDKLRAQGTFVADYRETLLGEKRTQGEP